MKSMYAALAVSNDGRTLSKGDPTVRLVGEAKPNKSV